jgi:uncharacterized membrane protein
MRDDLLPRDMKKNVITFTATMLSIFVFSFFLNYVWESYHAVFLYEKHNFRAEKYVQMLTYVSVVDSFLIGGIYLFIAALWKDLFWLLAMDRKHIWTACVSGVVLAAFIEYRKVFILKIWSYTALMPTLFGIGISPLVQLPATGLLAFWLTRKLLYQKEK